MQLTEHFTLEEFIVTSHRDIDNTPSLEIIESLKVTAAGFERIRLVLGKPFLILSGHRCAALNCIVGGAMTEQSLTSLSIATTNEIVRRAARARLLEHMYQANDSQHMKGEAGDGISPAFGTPFEVCKAIEANRDQVLFDQLIYEGTWCHAAFVSANPRGQVLTMRNGKYLPGLVAIGE